MRLQMRLVTFALALGLVIGWSGSSRAFPYSISSSILITAANNGGSGVLGSIDPLTQAQLAGATICLAGVCSDFDTVDWLIVTMTLSAGSADVDQIGIGVPGVATLQGVGHYTDPDETPTGGSFSATVGLIDYDFGSTSALNLEAGETTDRLFAVFALGVLPGPGIPTIIDPGTVSFMISSGANFSVQGTLLQIPEPRTAFLLGMGLLTAGLSSRFSRSRS